MIIKSKRGALKKFVQILLWIVFFVIATTGVYFLIKFLTGGI